MRITLVAAASENKVIGKDNRLLWHLPNDLKFFKEYTLGKVIVMGRKTFESINSRPLPRRTNIVLTHNNSLSVEGVETAISLEAVLQQYASEEEICIVGGEQIYRMALPVATDIRLTRVHVKIEGDTFFPDFPEDQWEIISCEPHPADEKHAYAYEFLHYRRH